MNRLHAKAVHEQTLVPLHDAVIFVNQTADHGTICAVIGDSGAIYRLAKELPMDEIDELFRFIKDQMTLPVRRDDDVYQVCDLGQHLEYFRSRSVERSNAKTAGALAGRHLTRDERIEAAHDSLREAGTIR